MTGYGRADEQNDQIVLSVEIRSVNSRFLDFSPRIPKPLQCFEDAAYKIVKQTCERGRVSLSVKLDLIPGTKNGMILNQDKLEEYMTIVRDIQKTSERDDMPSIGDILRLPEIFSNGEPNNENELKDIFLRVLKKTLTELEKIRISEGENIQVDINMRMDILKDTTDKIHRISDENRAGNMERYKQKLNDLIEDINIDESRLYQEIAILSEKKDITEELVRLGSHFDLFINSINASENNGKKLNFLLQEIGREINTIASKTDIIEINHLAVDMKDELEKIREQVQNIV